jgi:dTDP-L-rhamnose 4-epimerase
MKSILITGGAGFIGSYVAEELLAAGYTVTIVDNLDEQVHEAGRRPDYLADDVEFVTGDVRDRDLMRRLVKSADAVIHLAAAVGVGQSMYQLHRYVDVNDLGTASLLEAVTANPVARLLVASSMSVYGEGAYLDGDNRLRHPPGRPAAQLARRDWDLRADNGSLLRPVPTSESVVPTPHSPYALTKYDQELLCLMIGGAYDVPTTALRLFNVYGPRQALSNPYTGVMAIFACRLLNGRPPAIYEDGEQLRDFVNVRDVARAFRLALQHDGSAGRAINVGSGAAISINDVARAVAGALDLDIEPEVAGKYRAGDIRHCFADISAARDLLGYAPAARFEDGLAELASWLAVQQATDRASAAADELARRGLTR